MRRLQQYTYQLFVSSCSAQVNLFILPVPTQFPVTCMPIVASACPESASAQATNPRSAAAASSILGFSMWGAGTRLVEFIELAHSIPQSPFRTRCMKW